MSNLITTQINQLAERFDLPQSEELYQVLKATAFKGEVSDVQLSALLIVAKQYGLNPWTKEIYAFPDKGGIVPVVGVDGWSRIINEHPQFDGEEFEYGPASQYKNKTVHEWIECVIYRKDRSKPTRIREYFDEVNRDSATPWNSHPKRMHRHKVLIQCARLAFGFGGIFDTDEAERIVEGVQPVERVIDPSTGEIKPKELAAYTDEKFKEMLPGWHKAIADRKATPEQIIAKAQTKGSLTEAQKKAIATPPAKSDDVTDVVPKVTYAAVTSLIVKATTTDELDEAATLIPALPADQQAEANTLYDKRKDELA